MTSPHTVVPSPIGDAAGSVEFTRWFIEHVQPHEPALRNWLRVRFSAIGDCDDLVQETFLRAWRAGSRGPVYSIKAFLFATARNLAIDCIKRQQREIVLGESAASAVLDEGSDPAGALARTQELALLRNALASLPKRCREVFTLRRIHGLSQREIAVRLGISEKTVEAQNSIAMHKCVQFFAQRTAQFDRVTPRHSSSALAALGTNPQHA